LNPSFNTSPHINTIEGCILRAGRDPGSAVPLILPIESKS
jgi:hypothetical protein